MTFLKWMLTWFFADHLASKQEEAVELDQLKAEVEDLRFEIEGMRDREDE